MLVRHLGFGGLFVVYQASLDVSLCCQVCPERNRLCVLANVCFVTGIPGLDDPCVEINCGSIVCDGFRKLALSLPGNTSVVKRPRILWVELDYVVEVGNTDVEFLVLKVSQGLTQCLGICFRRAWWDFGCHAFVLATATQNEDNK